MSSGNRLEGKTAILTGGASGIGEATSRLFVDQGARVVIADIDDSKGNALEAELNQNGEVAMYRKLDVTQESRWIEVIDEMMMKWGRLDIVVNNAGMSGAKGRATVEDTIVEVVATEEGVATRCQHFKDVLADLEDRNVERTATEVINSDLLVEAFTKAIGEGGSRGFVEDA